MTDHAILFIILSSLFWRLVSSTPEHYYFFFFFVCPKRKDPAVFMSLVNNNKYDCLYTYILYAQANFHQATNKHMQIQALIQRSFFIISFFCCCCSFSYVHLFSLNLIDFFEINNIN